MAIITQPQQKELLLLTDRKWKLLQSEMKKHYRTGTYISFEYTFLLALTSEQWHTVRLELQTLRDDNKDRLKQLRKITRVEAGKNKKKEYMRQYMQKYRKRKEDQHGQGSTQGSG